MKIYNKTAFLAILMIFLIFINSASAISFSKISDEYYYSSKDKAFNIYFNSVAGFIITKEYKQISSVKIIDINGKYKILKNSIDFKNKKTKLGYSTDININKNKMKLDYIKKIDVNFVKQPDLKISKIKKKNNKYIFSIKNIGTASAKKNYLGISAQKDFLSKKKLIKKVKVPLIKAGKSKNVEVSLKSKYKKYTKIATVDYKNQVNEVSKLDNSRYF